MTWWKITRTISGFHCVNIETLKIIDLKDNDAYVNTEDSSTIYIANHRPSSEIGKLCSGIEKFVKQIEYDPYV